MTQIFRIRNRHTGEYSKGGSYPCFSARGKIWTTRAALSNHLNLAGTKYYKDCDVITYELSETELMTESVMDVAAAGLERKADREAKRRARIAEAQRQHKLKQYNALRAELGLDK